MLIIPAIDILDGACVRLLKGDYDRKTVYSNRPSDIAAKFARSGFPFLHVVDLDGAREGRVVNWKSLEGILSLFGVSAEVGGGVRTTEDIRRLLNMGARRVVIGSVAAKSPELAGYWIEQFGAGKIAIGMDVRNESVAVSGWLEDSKLSPSRFLLDMISRGGRTFICTDISRDGTLEGTNVEFFAGLVRAFPAASFVASGGVTCEADLEALSTSGVSAAIIGKALYEGRISLTSLERFRK